MAPSELHNGRKPAALTDRIDVASGLPESSNADARQRRSEGDTALESGTFESAIALYHSAISIDSTCIRAHHNMGVVFYRQGDWKAALDSFKNCMKLSPDNADLRYKAGLCLVKGDRLQEAKQAFETALEKYPDHLHARFHLSLQYARGAPGSEDRLQAIDGLRYILQAADRGVPCPILDRTCFLLGSFLDDRPENAEEAILAYRRGLEADPFFAPGHNNLGVLLMQSNQTLQALGAFKIAIHLEPDYTLPYRNLAQLLFDRMSPAQMEQEYTSIIDEFGARAASALVRLSMELIDLGRAQVGESLYTQGHQIKNLMGLVGSRTRRLIRKPPPDATEELQAITREQERIYDQWVVYLRSMKQDPMNPSLVDVPQLVQKIHETVSSHAGTKTLKFVSENRVPHVKVDPGMLHEAITNLVINALEAVDETGTVTVQAGYDIQRASVFIEVEDNGPGIPRLEQNRIFDPGYSTKEKGNGFGLSICARIISAHRGNLRVISRPGAGAVFRIDLPVDFELTSEEESISLHGTPIQAARHPVAEEFID
ncbi:MAG: tetratricopeptide repeat protein [bacterium]|nr:tetratricopeptide repeat protein [bacterium]